MDTPVTVVPPFVQLTGLIKFDPSRPPKKLTAKLTKIAKALGILPKNGWNDHFKYNFLKESDLADALRDHLEAAGIFFFAANEIIKRESAGTSRSGAVKYLTDVRVEIMFSDSESGEWIIVPGEGTGEDNSDKGTYKGITGAVKYVLMKSFNVSTGDDPENADKDEAKKSKNQTSKPAANQQQGVHCAECNKAISVVKTKTETFSASQWAQKTKKAFGQVLCLEHTKGKKPAAKVETTETDSGDGFRLLRGVLKSVDERKTTKTVKGKRVESKWLLLTMENGIQVSNWHQSQFDIQRKAVGKVIEVTVKLEQKGDITYRNCEWTLEADGVRYVPGTDGKPIKQSERDLQVDDNDAPDHYEGDY